MVAQVVIDRRDLPRNPRGPRQSSKSHLPRALGAKGPTPGLHLSGVQIEAPPKLWEADSDLVGVLTPVLPFNNHSPLTCSDPVGVTAHFSFRSFTCNTYGPPASVANKRLTACLNPLAATLTKNTGGGGSPRLYMSTTHPARMLILRSPPRRTTKDLSSHPTSIARTAARTLSYLEVAPMRRRLIRIALILLLFPPLLAAVAGWLSGPAFLHPIRRELTPDLIREADASFAVTGAAREDFDVRAPDG